MKYYIETSLDKFPWWGGATDNFNELAEHQAAYKYVEDLLDDATEDGAWSETEVNDFMWFYLYEYLIDRGFMSEDETWLD